MNRIFLSQIKYALKLNLNNFTFFILKSYNYSRSILIFYDISIKFVLEYFIYLIIEPVY